MEMLSTLNNNIISQTHHDLDTQGFAILDDVLPEQVALDINNLFIQCKNWENIDQVREDHYSHVFKFKSTHLPQEGEIYTAKFGKSFSLAETISPLFTEYFIPILNRLSPFNLTDYDVRCHKQSIGDHYRTHVDGYAGKLNLIYYVNKEWRWDWGGILSVLDDTSPNLNIPIFPKFNRVVLLNNKTFRSPHIVSSVEPFALSSRFSIVSFNK